MAKIVLIDDDELTRSSIMVFLEHAGHEVLEADNGKEGLEICENQRVDLVITDIFMDGMLGLEVIKTLKKKKDHIIPVIGISGGGGPDGQDDYLHVALKMGAECVLSKPIVAEEMLHVIDKLLK